MAKTLLVRVALSFILSFASHSTVQAAPDNPSLIATPPQPAWSELTTRQKIVLAPLSDSWDAMENYRQKKWLSIASRFATQSPEEQRRIQTQMREWNKLTPDQQQQARKNFKTANQLTHEKKQELKQKWAEYSRLPEAEKQKFKRENGAQVVSSAASALETLPETAGASLPPSSGASETTWTDSPTP